MHLFYTPDLSGKQYTLNEQESKHCVRVLRLGVGDKIQLIDGKGGFYEAEIDDARPKACSVVIVSEQQEFGKRDFRLHMAVAPTKNIDRTEWFLEKATEIGVDEITPLLCQRSERKVIKAERLEKVITSAVKQSLKAYHPVLNELTAFKKFVGQSFDGRKFIAHCESSDTEKPHLFKTLSANQDVLLLVGPEGDFSPEEIELAKANGFEEISLGEARLRTETAGVAGVHIVNLANI